MAKFSRSNVSDSAFSKSAVDRSSYDKSENTTITPKLGAFHPVRCVRLMPNTTLQGSVEPRLQLEKVISPQIGRTRLDVHTFSVPFRRICNDFKIGLEKQNFSNGDLLTLGQFDMYELFNVLFTSLFFYRTSTSGTISSQLSLSLVTSVYERVAANVSAAGLPALPDVQFDIAVQGRVYSNYASRVRASYTFDIMSLIVDSVEHIRLIYAMYAFDDDEQGLLNYPKDFYALEYLRLSEYSSYLQSLTPGDFMTLNVYDVICTLLEPYVGINSNADMLGYPILRKFGSLSDVYSSLESSDISFLTDGSSSVPLVRFSGNSDYPVSSLLLVSSFLLPYSGSVTIEFNGQILFDAAFNPFKLYHSIFDDFIASGMENFYLFQQTLPYRLYSDFPLRAAYACWFDRMRDWHVENRAMCLDPDTFTHVSLFSGFISLGILHEGKSVFNIPQLRTVAYALLVPRQRFFADDALTTIKTDDKFRHVYSPIMELDDVQGAVDTRSDDVLNNIERIYLDSLAIAFPSGSLFGNIKSDANLQALRNDLCLAKRAGMLERWLARNYFTPDNYNGFISAHFDTDVSDMDMLISKYLGGSEQMVSGDQQVASMTTENTERGTRTFSGGVSASADFSIQVTDYSYLVSFVSLVPLVEYDALSPAVLETNFNELPSPEYANDTRIEARLSDFVRDFALNHDIIGYVPRYYLDRTCLDSVHGRYLTDYRSYSWFRDWYNMTFVSGSNFGSHGFALTPYSLRIHLPLDSFFGLAPWDSVAFGEISMPLALNVPLSAAIEII